MVLQLSKVAMAIRLQLPLESLANHVVASPVVVGENIAQQVHAYAIREGLGYYPAIDYFQQQTGIDPDLITALENISWIATGMVRNEIRIRMRPVFSTIKFESLQTIAYTMPNIRPGQKDALPQLIKHFTADTVKVNLNATLIQKINDPQFAEKLASSMAYRWLKPHFVDVDVTGVKFLD